MDLSYQAFQSQSKTVEKPQLDLSYSAFQQAKLPDVSGSKAVREFPGTLNTLSELQLDPLSLKADPSKAISDAWESMKGSVERGAESLAKLFSSRSPSEFIGNLGGAVSAEAGAFFSPVTSLFTAAKDIPVLGSVSKLISLPFEVTGEGLPKISNKIIDELPISQKAKDNLKPGIGEIFALAGQLALGKIADVGLEKTKELTAKYGETDANTIINKAKELSQQKVAIDAVNKAAPGVPKVDLSYESFQKSQPAQGGVPETNTLISEARKYKTAEEFVKAQTPVFRGATAENMLNDKGRGISFSTNKEVASRFSTQDFNGFPQKGSVGEFYLKPDAKILDPKTLTAQKIKGDLTRENIIKYARDNGYDAVDLTKAIDPKLGYKPENELRILNTNAIKTKSQLTDIWNKYQQSGVPETVNPTPVEGTGTTQTRGLAQGIADKALANGLKDTFGDLPEYKTVDFEQQAKLANDLVSKDYSLARRIALGEEPVPKGILPEAVLKAVEDKAILEGDVATARALATQSSLTTEATTMGQRIGYLATRDPESPVGVIKEIADARRAAYEAKNKGVEIDKIRKETIDTIKSEIQKTAPTPKTWSEFIDSLNC